MIVGVKKQVADSPELPTCLAHPVTPTFLSTNRRQHSPDYPLITAKLRCQHRTPQNLLNFALLFLD